MVLEGQPTLHQLIGSTPLTKTRQSDLDTEQTDSRTGENGECTAKMAGVGDSDKVEASEHDDATPEAEGTRAGLT